MPFPTSPASQLAALGPTWLQPDALLTRFGTWALVAVMVIVFVECGLLLFFLPGDSLLFVTGIFVGSGAIATPLWLTCVLLTAAAFLGNLSGYAIGYKAGPALFHRPDSRLLKPEYVARTHAFFERHGARAVVLARFVPIVRTFITAMAGVGRMDWRRYAAYSFVGAVLWASGLTILGYVLGSVTFVKNNIEVIAVLIVALSLLPVGFEWYRNRGRSEKAPVQA